MKNYIKIGNGLVREYKNDPSYKGTYSIVLLALVDAFYTFSYVDVGCNGRFSDGGVFNNSSLCPSLSNNDIKLPEPSALRSRTKLTPYVIVADDAFAMKPDPNRLFNYRLPRARPIVENRFGIIAN
jgi:hypothetical protein